jgi:glutamate formiminotransferase/glutamate formiminotransferase/formiminotetrahydrofolate cyclodeaminase
MELIEAIPNVSEGRRADVIGELTDAVTSAGADVVLLDRSSDRSHNRAVFTMAGTADGVARAVHALAAVAVARIDLRSHAGVHPRIGALDVVPFVPLGTVPMTRAIDLARRVARDLSDSFALPTYLYGAAASDAARRRLELVRRGGFEGLAARMSDPAWRPDFGPLTPHASAGAACVGARGPLIAWNLNLDSTDLALAREIARTVRTSDGGLPHVKAMGVRLAHRGLVQVSMNLTDYRVTSMSRVFTCVERHAAARGAAIRESEVIGLLPRAALDQVASHSPWLAEQHRHQVLEDRLADAWGSRAAEESGQ